jgi:hypothetical protein
MSSDSNLSQQYPKSSSATKQQTSTTALIVLVSVTLVVAGTALSLAQPTATKDLDQPPEVNPKISSETDFRSRRNLSAALNAFPQTLPAPQPSRVVTILQKKNNNVAQHIVRYETNKSLDDLYTEYRSWAETSKFRVTNVSRGSSGAALILGNSNSQLFITMNNVADRRRVALNQVTK